MKRRCVFILTVSLLVLILFGSIEYLQVQRNNEYKQIGGVKYYTSQNISDLALLCKVWGYLKYYHPAVVEGKYNWDDELIKMMTKVLKSKSKENRNQILLEWVTSLGEFTQDTLPEINPDSVKMYPDLDWITDKKELGTLYVQLEKIKTAKRPYDKSFYVSFKEAGNPDFSNENAYPDMSYPDASYRLLCLFRYWNIIQYYFPYKYLIGEDWKNVLVEFIPEFINAKNELEYKLTLLKLIASIHDSHARISDKTLAHYKGDYIVPFYLSFVENKFIVTDTLIDITENNYPLKIGDIILKVNGKPVDRITSEKLPYTPGSNLPNQLGKIGFDILRGNTNNIHVTFRRGKDILSKNMTCYSLGSSKFRNLSNKNKPLYSLISKNKNIGYLYLGGQGVIPDFMNTKGLVIDLRCYPTRKKIKGYMVLQELYEHPKKFVKFTATNFKKPGLFKYFEDYYTDLAKNDTTAKFFRRGFYKGKVIILVNELTGSHTEFMAMMYQQSPTATVVGSTTAGADGDISHIPLLGNLMTVMTGLGVYYPDGRETQRVGIVPDIKVKPTLKGIREGRDEVLEKAVELIEKQ